MSKGRGREARIGGSARLVVTNNRGDCRIFRDGPMQVALKTVSINMYRLERAERDKKRGEIAYAAVDYMKLDEDKPL